MSRHNLTRRLASRASLLPAAIAVVLALGAASATAAQTHPDHPGPRRQRPPGRLPVAEPVAVRSGPGPHAAGPDDPERQDRGGRGPRHQRAVRLLRGRAARALHPGAGPGGRAERRRRRAHRRHPAARRGIPGRHLRPGAGPPVRRGRRLGGVGQGRGGQPGPDGQHRPRPALGPLVRVVHRGPLPERGPGRVRDRRRAEHRRDVAGQALRRLQPGDQPQHPRR